MPKTLSQVLALPPLQWRIASLLPLGGIFAIGGAPKRGKSRLAIDLARRLVQGRQVFSTLSVQRAARVLLYNTEGGYYGVRARASMFTPVAPDEQERLLFEEAPIVFTHATGAVRGGAIEEAAAAWTGFDVVVLDPLVHFRACDENNNQHSALLMRAIRQAAERVGAAVIVVHHARKSGTDSERGGEELRGASALFAAADNVMMVYLTEDDLLECTFDLRYDPPGTLEGLVLQSDLASGLLYRRVKIGTTTVPDPADFALDWGRDPKRYAHAFDLAPELARRMMEMLPGGNTDAKHDDDEDNALSDARTA